MNLDLDAIRKRAENCLPPDGSEYPINEEQLALDVLALVGRVRALEASREWRTPTHITEAIENALAVKAGVPCTTLEQQQELVDALLAAEARVAQLETALKMICRTDYEREHGTPFQFEQKIHGIAHDALVSAGQGDTPNGSHEQGGSL